MISFSLLWAVLMAGMLGGAHCVGMCGGIACVLERKEQSIVVFKKNWHISNTVYLHIGRITMYMLMGAVMGGVGSISLVIKPFAHLHFVWFLIGNLALIALGLRLVRVRWYLRYPVFERVVQYFLSYFKKLGVLFADRVNKHPFVTGMIWGIMPCGVTLSVLFFSLLTGHVFWGAVLMGIFGLITLPYLLLVRYMHLGSYMSNLSHWLRWVGGSSLMGMGIWGILHYNETSKAGWLCFGF
jgi:sulfite exporter TauE/SafE